MSGRRKRCRPLRDDWHYRQLWRIVDGAVADTFATHPDYLTRKGKRSARRSINKRVVGSIIGYAAQVAEGRSGTSPAADGGMSLLEDGRAGRASYCPSWGRAALQHVARLWLRCRKNNSVAP